MKTLVNTINLSDGTNHYKFTVGQMVIYKLDNGVYAPVIIERIEMVAKDEPYWIDSVGLVDELKFSAPHTSYQTVDDLVYYLKEQQVSSIMERMIKLGKEKGLPKVEMIPYIEQSGEMGVLKPRLGVHRPLEKFDIGMSDAIIGTPVPGVPYMTTVKESEVDASEVQIIVMKNRYREDASNE